MYKLLNSLDLDVWICYILAVPQTMTDGQVVKGVTVNVLRNKVVIKFISSFWCRGTFCQCRHFVRVCVCVCVCVCLPPAVEYTETVCVVPFWTALNFPKRFVSGCKEKVE